MTSSANKKVFITRFGHETGRDSIHGYVQTPESFGSDGLELLTLSGTLLTLPYPEVKVVSFVRDFEGGDTWRTHRAFASRPKSPGLWIKCMFRDGDSTEGVLANNLALLEGTGFYLIPPDPSFQNQRLFIPRQALNEARVLGVIGGRPLPKPRPKRKPADEEQLEMFS